MQIAFKHGLSRQRVHQILNEHGVRATYLRTAFTRESPYPHGEHVGVLIKELPLTYVAEVVRAGLEHRQLLGILQHELRIRAERN